MPARRFRSVALLALTLAALSATACVRGRNDGGKEGAGNSGNGAGPAAEPGPAAGTNTDTTMIAPAASNTPTTPAANAPAATKKP